MFFTTPETRDLLARNPEVVLGDSSVPANKVVQDLNDLYILWYNAVHDCDGHVDFYVYEDDHLYATITRLTELKGKVESYLGLSNELLLNAVHKLLDTIQIDIDDLNDILAK